MPLAKGPAAIRQQRLHRLALLQGQGMTVAPALIPIRLRTQISGGLHGPGFRPGSHHPAIGGVIHGADRLIVQAEQLALGGCNRLAHSSSRMAGIAVDLTLGVAAEVIAINAEAMAVGQGPGARQNGLGLQRRHR